MRRWIIAGIVAAAGIGALLLVFVFNEPVVNAGENGTFANDCCGTIQLSDGKMLLNDQQTVRYTVAKDANGPYILPYTYVGVVRDEGFEIDGSRSTIKLRLDRLPWPTRIVLYEGLRPYIFTRHAPARGTEPLMSTK
ncbi:MAG: hypothetical protein ACJ8FT_01375 [Sphingomonas sp.]